MSTSDELKTAWADVQSAELPEHVQAVALAEVLRLRFGTGVAQQAKPEPWEKHNEPTPEPWEKHNEPTPEPWKKPNRG
jgi:hypothetical protein